MKAPRLVAVLLLAVLLVGANTRLPDWHDQQFRPPAEGRTRVDLVLDLLGELRTFMARSIFIRADLYHHVMENQGISWTQERDILPIYRVATLLDPSLVDAYDTAAYDLVINFGREKEGLAFLQEGIRRNPDSAQLYLSLAFLLSHVKRYEEAVPAAGRAMQLAQDRIDLLNAIRLLTHAQAELENRPGEIHGLRMWLTVAPDDAFARDRLRALGQEPRGFTEEELKAMGQGAPPSP